MIDHLWAGSSFDCTAHWQMSPRKAPWHLQTEMCRTAHNEGRKHCSSALKKDRSAIRVVTDPFPIISVLVCSAKISQTDSAPQFTQKQNRDNPRVQGLCMLTWPLAGLFCFGDVPKWHY